MNGAPVRITIAEVSSDDCWAMRHPKVCNYRHPWPTGININFKNASIIDVSLPIATQ